MEKLAISSSLEDYLEAIAEIIEKVLNCFSPRGEVSAETIKKTDAEVKKVTASLTAEI